MDLHDDAGIFLNFAHKWRRARKLGVSAGTYEECLFCERDPSDDGQWREISPCLMCDGSGNVQASTPSQNELNETIMYATEALEFQVRANARGEIVGVRPHFLFIVFLHQPYGRTGHRKKRKPASHCQCPPDTRRF